jgi:hypothetical protein
MFPKTSLQLKKCQTTNPLEIEQQKELKSPKGTTNFPLTLMRGNFAYLLLQKQLHMSEAESLCYTR